MKHQEEILSLLCSYERSQTENIQCSLIIIKPTAIKKVVLGDK